MSEFQRSIISFVYFPAGPSSDDNGSPDVDKIQVRLKGNTPPRTFQFSQNMKMLSHLPLRDYEATDELEELHVDFYMEACLAVKKGAHLLWGMNNGTMWLDPSKITYVRDLSNAIHLIKSPSQQDDASVKHTDSKGNVMQLRLLDADAITTWLDNQVEGEKVMPQTSNKLVEYVTLVLLKLDKGQDEEDDGGRSEAASKLIRLTREPAPHYGLWLTLKEAGTYELSEDLAEFLDYSGSRTITVYTDPHSIWHYDRYDNPSSVTLHHVVGEDDSVVLNVTKDHVLECHHGLQYVLNFHRM